MATRRKKHNGGLKTKKLNGGAFAFLTNKKTESAKKAADEAAEKATLNANHNYECDSYKKFLGKDSPYCTDKNVAMDNEAQVQERKDDYKKLLEDQEFKNIKYENLNVIKAYNKTKKATQDGFNEATRKASIAVDATKTGFTSAAQTASTSALNTYEKSLFNNNTLLHKIIEDIKGIKGIENKLEVILEKLEGIGNKLEVNESL